MKQARKWSWTRSTRRQDKMKKTKLSESWTKNAKWHGDGPPTLTIIDTTSLPWQRLKTLSLPITKTYLRETCRHETYTQWSREASRNKKKHLNWCSIASRLGWQGKSLPSIRRIWNKKPLLKICTKKSRRTNRSVLHIYHWNSSPSRQTQKNRRTQAI